MRMRRLGRDWRLRHGPRSQATDWGRTLNYNGEWDRGGAGTTKADPILGPRSDQDEPGDGTEFKSEQDLDQEPGPKPKLKTQQGLGTEAGNKPRDPRPEIQIRTEEADDILDLYLVTWLEAKPKANRGPEAGTGLGPRPRIKACIGPRPGLGPETHTSVLCAEFGFGSRMQVMMRSYQSSVESLGPSQGSGPSLSLRSKSPTRVCSKPSRIPIQDLDPYQSRFCLVQFRSEIVFGSGIEIEECGLGRAGLCPKSGSILEYEFGSDSGLGRKLESTDPIRV
uniref:Uncharacterized protein n=1 Tax=Cannabis sativa TaxID=3483 RepID=A0A803PKR9_CANSA